MPSFPFTVSSYSKLLNVTLLYSVVLVSKRVSTFGHSMCMNVQKCLCRLYSHASCQFTAARCHEHTLKFVLRFSTLTATLSCCMRKSVAIMLTLTSLLAPDGIC